jgi:hypothetical protein
LASLSVSSKASPFFTYFKTEMTLEEGVWFFEHIAQYSICVDKLK